MPFEIFQKSRRVAYSVGFCEKLHIRDGHIFPINPFAKAQLHVPGGWIDCRGDWHGPKHLPIEGLIVRPVPVEIWMRIPMLDAICAIDLCRAYSIDLGRDGYSRIPLP
jgi:hypothetical protein